MRFWLPPRGGNLASVRRETAVLCSAFVPTLLRRALEIYATRIPYHRGKWRVVELGLRVVGADGEDDFVDGRTMDIVRDGIKWRIGTTCAVQRRLYWHGGFEMHEVHALLDGLRPGNVFFDVGSYFGYYAMLAAKRGARAYAFEPVQANFEMLAVHKDLNAFDDLHVFRAAVSDQAGAVFFEEPNAGNRGTGHLTGAAGRRAVQVDAVTLDAFMDDQRIERLDAVKIDVEGAELKVLAGASATLTKFHPMLLVELNPPCLERFGANETVLLSTLRDLGYDMFRARKNGLEKYVGLLPYEEFTNIICVRR